MPDGIPLRDPNRPGIDPQLGLLALRYAAQDLPPAAVDEFEAQLATEQAAREALAEAVRLSFAATGQAVPTPDPLGKSAVRERLWPTWVSRLFPRRPYRGHPAAWATMGGIAAAVALALLPAHPPAALPMAGMSPPTPSRGTELKPAPHILSSNGDRYAHKSSITIPRDIQLPDRSTDPMVSSYEPPSVLPSPMPLPRTPEVEWLPAPMASPSPRAESKPEDPMTPRTSRSEPKKS